MEITEIELGKLTKVNLTAGWAKERLRILIEMMVDREKGDDLRPINIKWLREQLENIRNGIEIVT